MTVAGDHAMNDMAGAEDDSWKSILTKDGISCVPILRAITENPQMVDIFISHSKTLMKHFK
jgi:sirohydrochlorin cobaltochelatase